MTTTNKTHIARAIALLLLTAPLPTHATPPTPALAPALAPAPAPNALTIKRLLVAKAITAREPVGAAAEFSTADTTRLYAFIEVNNPSATATEVTVTWVDTTSGKARRPYPLQIGAHKSWRTWARTAAPKQPGSFAVLLKDTSGAELARAEFVMK